MREIEKKVKHHCLDESFLWKSTRVETLYKRTESNVQQRGRASKIRSVHSYREKYEREEKKVRENEHTHTRVSEFVRPKKQCNYTRSNELDPTVATITTTVPRDPRMSSVCVFYVCACLLVCLDVWVSVCSSLWVGDGKQDDRKK